MYENMITEFTAFQVIELGSYLDVEFKKAAAFCNADRVLKGLFSNSIRAL